VQKDVMQKMGEQNVTASPEFDSKQANRRWTWTGQLAISPVYMLRRRLKVLSGTELCSPGRNAETMMWVVAKRRKYIYFSEWKYWPVHLCSVCKLYMLISFSICQALPNGNIIHEGQILSTSHSTGCRSPASHRRGIFSGWILVACTG
jgi:hypothetical protein